MNKQIIVKDLGIVDYDTAWQTQQQLFNTLQQQKTSGLTTDNYLLLCEHPHVYTLGKSGEESNLLVNQDFLKSIDATFFKTDRGGDITYHGYGQLVGYPIIDLDNFNLSTRLYIEMLEDVIITYIAKFGLSGHRLPGATGVWLLASENQPDRKICAIGVKISRHITMHGFAFNVNTNLAYFNYINPCGFTDKSVTSLQNELKTTFNMDAVKNSITDIFIQQLTMLKPITQNY